MKNTHIVDLGNGKKITIYPELESTQGWAENDKGDWEYITQDWLRLYDAPKPDKYGRRNSLGRVLAGSTNAQIDQMARRVIRDEAWALRGAQRMGPIMSAMTRETWGDILSDSRRRIR